MVIGWVPIFCFKGPPLSILVSHLAPPPPPTHPLTPETKKALYLGVNVLSKKVLIEDTILTSPTGDRTAILRGHPSHTKVWPFARQR